MRRRTMATIKLDPEMVDKPENRAWLVKSLKMIIDELNDGQHRTSLVLEIFESDAQYERRRALAAQEAT